jgi:protoheme IX farnesyltransferase
LKRRTRWATEIGAVSGALPALLGNAAAGELAAVPGLTLTAVLLCWQMPHFFALGWRHRDDYRAAGFPLLPAIDATGARTAAWSLGYAVALFVVSLLPWVAGELGAVYGMCALGAGLDFLRRAWRFRRDATGRDAAAARLFAGSLLHLPIVMLALLVDRLGPW